MMKIIWQEEIPDAAGSGSKVFLVFEIGKSSDVPKTFLFCPVTERGEGLFEDLLIARKSENHSIPTIRRAPDS